MDAGQGRNHLPEAERLQGSQPIQGQRIGIERHDARPQGRLTVAGHAQRDVYRLESLTPGAPVTILADNYQGKRLNSPNDLVYKSDGSLYFTDPPYGLERRPTAIPRSSCRSMASTGLPMRSPQGRLGAG